MAVRMHFYVGTSGFAYRQWKGAFYPETLRDEEMLAWYAGRFTAVEVNSTFYRFPTRAGLGAWAAGVPDPFRFAFKVPRRITHIKRLQDVDEDVGYLIETLLPLGPHLGPLLFQLPSAMHLDLDSLAVLLARLPPNLRVAFEFRHPSWFCDALYRLLEKEQCALCYNDVTMPDDLHPTTDWGYLRVRREHYSEAELAASVHAVLKQPWREAYVFVKHEGPDAPLLAGRWLEIATGLRTRHVT